MVMLCETMYVLDFAMRITQDFVSLWLVGDVILCFSGAVMSIGTEGRSSIGTEGRFVGFLGWYNAVNLVATSSMRALSLLKQDEVASVCSSLVVEAPVLQLV